MAKRSIGASKTARSKAVPPGLDGQAQTQAPPDVVVEPVDGTAAVASLDDLVAALDGDDGVPTDAGGRSRKRGGATHAGESTQTPTGSESPTEEVPGSPPSVQLSDSLPMDEDDDLSQVEGEASARLVSIVESVLFAATKPLGARELRGLLKDATLRQVQLALKQLGRDLEGRGVVLTQVAGGFRLRTNPENGRWVQLLLAEKPARLSRSQLEALAVIAYRQPITKPEVDHVRGVDCGAVLKVLLDHDLVRIVGRKEEPGRPHLYGTTVKFLEFFNLRSLRDMPDLHEFRELNEENQAVVRERLGEPDLFDDREAMGQEVIDWGDGATGAGQVGDDDGGVAGGERGQDPTMEVTGHGAQREESTNERPAGEVAGAAGEDDDRASGAEAGSEATEVGASDDGAEMEFADEAAPAGEAAGAVADGDDHGDDQSDKGRRGNGNHGRDDDGTDDGHDDDGSEDEAAEGAVDVSAAAPAVTGRSEKRGGTRPPPAKRKAKAAKSRGRGKKGRR